MPRPGPSRWPWRLRSGLSPSTGLRVADLRGFAVTGTTPTGTPPRCCPPGGGFRCLAGFPGRRGSTQPSISTTSTPGVSQAAKPASTHCHGLIPTPSGIPSPDTGHALYPSTEQPHQRVTPQPATSLYVTRSCRGEYQADRHPGAGQYTTRWPTDQPPRLGKEGLAKAGKIPVNARSRHGERA